jgi:hypothetical protein
MVHHKSRVRYGEQMARQNDLDAARRDALRVIGSMKPKQLANIFGPLVTPAPAPTPDRAQVQQAVIEALQGADTREQQEAVINELLVRFGIEHVIAPQEVKKLLDEAGAPTSKEQDRINTYVQLAERHARGELDDDAYVRALQLLEP